MFGPTTYLDRHLEPPIYNVPGQVGYTDIQSWHNRALERVDYQDAGEVKLRAGNVVAYYDYRPAKFVQARRIAASHMGL